MVINIQIDIQLSFFREVYVALALPKEWQKTDKEPEMELLCGDTCHAYISTLTHLHVMSHLRINTSHWQDGSEQRKHLQTWVVQKLSF